MSGHPNRNWRKGWRVDPASLTAVHDSGLRVLGRLIDGGIDIEVEQASMPAPGPNSTPADMQALGRELGRRCEEGGRLLLEAVGRDVS